MRPQIETEITKPNINCQNATRWFEIVSGVFSKLIGINNFHSNSLEQHQTDFPIHKQFSLIHICPFCSSVEWKNNTWNKYYNRLYSRNANAWVWVSFFGSKRFSSIAETISIIIIVIIICASATFIYLLAYDNDIESRFHVYEYHSFLLNSTQTHTHCYTHTINIDSAKL